MSTFCPLLKLQFLGLTMIVFYLKNPKTIFSDVISVKKSDEKKFISLTLFIIILFFPQYQNPSFLMWFLWKTPIRKSSIFGQNPWAKPFKKNVHFWALVKTSIFWSWIDCFLSKVSNKRIFGTQFLSPTAIRKSSIFGQNPLTNRLGKCPFFGPL